MMKVIYRAKDRTEGDLSRKKRGNVWSRKGESGREWNAEGGELATGTEALSE